MIFPMLPGAQQKRQLELGAESARELTGTGVEDVIKLELEELGSLLDRSEDDLVGLRVEVLGDELGEESGGRGGLLGGLVTAGGRGVSRRWIGRSAE